ncbi:TPA: hypothetical protein QDB45_001659 [Burkholderia vietnamiensis]|nr:hypothetical protein [Burkholderia vietnamiensis]
MSTVRLSTTTNVMLTVAILAERITESFRETIARWTGKTVARTQGAQIPTVEVTHIKDVSEGACGIGNGSYSLLMYEALREISEMYETSLTPLYAQYLSTVGGDPMDALSVCMNDPEKAQAAIDAFTASLHTIADEAMAESPAPAQPRARQRL